MITKHYCKSIVRVALLLALTMCITGLAPAFSTSARAYSINDVSGIYVLHGEGWYFGSGNVHYVPNAFAGLTTFTPATGTFHGDWILRSDGVNTNVVVDGTYTVDTDGHGTMTWTSPLSGNTAHTDFYIVNGGAELKALQTDPPGTAKASQLSTMTKQ